MVDTDNCLIGEMPKKLHIPKVSGLVQLQICIQKLLFNQRLKKRSLQLHTPVGKYNVDSQF